MKFKILQFIFCFSILVSPHLSFGQLPAESNNFITYDTIYNGPGQTWRIRISRPANMFTAGHPDTASRPAIITMPGIGEVGTNYANLQKYGPHYWLNNGWDGSVITGSGKHYPILITVIAEAVNPRASSTIPLIQHLLNTYHIKRNSVHLAGLSMGAFTWAALMNAQTSAGDETGMKMIKSLVLLQGAGQGATSGLMGSAIPYDPTGFSAFGHWAAKYNGKFFGLEGTNDGRKVWEPRDNMNDSIPNSAYFSYETYGGGSHCCWNTMYDPNNKNWRSIPTVTNTNIGYGAHPNSMGSYTDGYSIFQWMIRQGDTSIVNGGTPANQSPTANAGSDKTITLPTNTVTVTGSGIDPDGTITGYQWTKLTGPSTYTIATPMQAQTAINNLVQGVYTFELRVTDNQGATGKDTVQVTVNAAGNQVPTANAGTNQSITLPTNIVTLTGTGTDPDGTISGYQWTKLTGPASYTIASPTQAQTAINNLVQGVYTFELRVTDNQGATGKDTIEVTVNTAANTNSNSNGVKVGTGEYQVGFIDSAKQLWGLGNLSNIGINGIGTVGVPKRMLVTPFDLKFNSVVGALHGLGAIDTAGYVWVVGDNDQFQHGQGNSINPILLPQRITVDSAGNPFTNVRDLVGWFVKDGSNGYNGFYAVKQDGTLWTWGRTVFGMRAVGVYGYDSPRPVQIIMPGGRLIKQIIAGQFAIALCTDGTVWTWGQGASANNLGMTSPTDDVKWYPRQLTSLSNIKQIAGGSNWNYALSNSNVLYGWGSYGDNLGNSNGLPIPTPSLLNNITNNLPHPINTIVTNSAVTHVILTDGSLWGWGDNGQGTVGNGQRVVFTIDGGNPFNRGNLQVVLPEHIAPGIIFDTVFGATTYTYHTYARDTSNNLYCWGRGKSAVLANQLRPTSSAITATYGNSWDIAYPTPVNPFTITTSYFQTSDYCVKVASGGSPCDQYAIPSNTRPNANAGNDTSITSNTFRLNATASTDNVFISRYEWSQVSGPSLASIDLPASKTPLVSGLITGTYVFKVLTEDNGWFLDSSNITIYVNSSPPPNQSPTANAGSDKTITLPTNTVMLTGSGIDPDGTITGYQWTKLTGPATYTIATPTQAQTAINNLVQGVYTFELRVTDNQGATGNDTVQITVNAANQSPTANAGSDKTITLPTNTVTITGSGIDPDGTISGYQWTKLTGPATYTITTPTQAQTAINNLVQGVYTFELRVTDNQGATGKDTVQVTVNAAANQSPSANAGSDKTITLPTNTVMLTGSGIDPDGTITGYQWTKLTGPATYTIATPTQAQTAINNLVQGVYTFELRVTDNQGATGNDTVQITVNAANQSPTANAGSDKTITLPTNTVTITGSGIDPDGTISGYQWTKLTGPATYTITTPTQAQTAINNLVQGVYTFELRVTDNQGATGKDTVQVTVNAAANQSPSANAGSDKTITLPTNTVMLTGSGIDPDGIITGYQWTKLTGPATYTIATPTQAQTAINNLVQGVYTFELRVTDNQGATGNDTVQITVNAANQSPTANAGSDKTITLPTNTVTITGSGIDPDGTISGYQWTKLTGPATYTITTPTQAQTAINNLVQGVYTFELRVTDNQGATGKDTVQVTVNAAANQSPSANAGSDKTITLPTNTVMLTGSGIDPDGTITGYQWTKLTGPATYTIATPTQAQTAINNLVQGVYTFELRVTDNQGATGNDTVQITVNAANQSPTANAGSDKTITLPTNTVTITGSGIDPDGTISGYQWTKLTGPSTYTIASPTQAQTAINNLVQGVYTFELRVTDNQGATGKDTVQVTVDAAANQSPTANAGSDKTITLPTNTVTVTGSGIDPDGIITGYQWTKLTGPATYTIASPTQAQTLINDLIAGEYSFELSVTDIQGAVDRDTMVITVNEALENNRTFLIFPNPAVESINIQFDKGTDQNKSVISIYTISGILVYSEEYVISPIERARPKQINISKLPAGIYFIKVDSNKNNSKGLKFIKQ